MSNSWLTGTCSRNNRILKAADGDERLAREIVKFMENGQVDKVLSRVDSSRNVKTYRLDENGCITGQWP